MTQKWPVPARDIGTASVPSLFSFATSELSQDAFLAWLLSWSDPRFATADAALHAVSTKLLLDLLRAGGVAPPDAVRSVEIARQHEHIDVLVVVNGALALIIEDKTNSDQHSDQLARYLAAAGHRFGPGRVAAVFLKTGVQSVFAEVERAGFGRFERRDLLKHLRAGREAGVRNDIFSDFTEYLEGLEAGVGAYARLPLADWGDDRRLWIGFYSAVREELGQGKWDYVPNAKGGFMGFWWHRTADKYLLLEQRRLAIKIWVTDTDKEQRSMRRDRWLAAVLAHAASSELPIRRPARLGLGERMTVAELQGGYLRADPNGMLDVPATLAVLRKAERLVDAAVSTLN